MMMIKVQGLPMAFSEAGPIQAARRIARQFGLLVEITAEQGPGGWPEVSIIGTPEQVMVALMSEGGWSCGDKDEDAEMLYEWFRSAVEVYK